MKFKSLFLLLIPASFGIAGHAASLTPAEALARLNGSGIMKSASLKSARISPAPVFTARNAAKEDMPLYYIFNGETDGFIIVSADDCAAPLLGYSDSARWEGSAMSPDMKWWLEQYAAEIASASASSITYEAATSPSRDAIAPLMTTKWNQDAPYNDMCPVVNSMTTYTGCVATAMAQVMKYHNWPEKGTGTNSYTWNQQLLSLDFSTVTFDWANMTDTYDSSSTETQNQAVAQLMYAAGIGVNMTYGIDQSGAKVSDIAPALVDYFGYDKSIYLAIRDLYSINEWESLVYDDLKAGRPVIYTGVSNEGAHCFVCDGYSSDGYFHINWGWGGISDGYFRLSALAPETQGIGGSNSAFTSNQMIVGNIKKAEEGSVESDPVFAANNMVSASISRNNVTLLGGFYNYSSRKVTGSLRLKAVNQATGEEKLLSGTPTANFKVGDGYMTISSSITSLADGSYRIYPVFRTADGSIYPVKVPTTQLGYAILEKGATSTIDFPSSGQFTVEDVTLNSELYWGSDFSVSGTLKNDGVNDLTLTVYPVLLSTTGYNGILGMGSAITLEVPAGGSVPVSYIGNWVQTISATMPTNAAYIGFMTPGTIVQSGLSNYEQTYIGISNPLPITLKNAGSTSVSIVSWSINDGNTSNVDKYNIPVSVDLKCSSGYFGGSLEFVVFSMLGNTSLAAFSSPTAFINSGSTETISFSGAFPTGNPGSRYRGAIFYGSKQLTPTLKNFVISKNSGIVEIEAEDEVVVTYNPATSIAEIMAPSAINAIEVYSLSGERVATSAEIDGSYATVEVSALPSGLYIVTISTADGIVSRKLLK